MEPVKILYLEDNPLDVKILESMLAADETEFLLDSCSKEKEFKQMLEEEQYDIIISDYYVPPYDGFKALDYIKEEYPLIPFILISGVAGEELAVEAIKRGATDYILKNNLYRLPSAIHKAILLFKEKELKQKAEDLRTKYDFIINTSRSLMSLIDRNYTYEAINNAFAAAHNLVKEEIIGKSLVEIWGDQSFKKVIKPNLDKTFADNEVRYQAWFETPKDGRRFFEVTFYPYKDEKGRVSHTVVDTFDITERNITEEEIKQHALDLTLINDLNEAINRGETLESILNILWSRTEQLFQSIGAGIYLISEDQNELVLQINQSAKKSIRRFEKLVNKKFPHISIPSSARSIYWNTFKTGKPYYTENQKSIVKLLREHNVAGNDEKLIQTAIKMLNLSSIINIPLFSGEKPLGIFTLARNRKFSKQEINRLIAFATQVTSILERVSIEERNRKHAEDQALINEINRAANEGKSLNQILTTLSESTRRMFSGYGASIYLVSDDGEYLLPTRFSLPDGVIASIEKLLGFKITSVRARLDSYSRFMADIQAGKPVVYDSRTEIKELIKEFAETKTMEKMVNSVAKIMNLKHLLNLPLISEDIPVGVLNISKEEPFSHTDIMRLEYIGSQITSVIRRKKAEEDFIESEQKYKALFESANDAIFLMDDNHFIDCNKPTLEMFGCLREEIIGQTPVMFSPEFQSDGRPSEVSAKEKIQKAMKGEEVRFEWIHKKLDGTPFLAEVSLNRLELKGREYLQAIVRDISKRKKAEEEIIEKEKGLREAQRIAVLGSWEWDLKKNKVSWSDQTYQILGLDPEHTKANLNAFLKKVHIDDRDRVNKIIQSAIDKKKPVEFFHRIIKPDKEERIVHSRVDMVCDSQNNPVRFIGTIHDLTDLRRAQKALQESEEKFRAIFEKGQFAVVLSTTEGKLIQTNQAAQELFGYSDKELKNKYFIDLTHPDDQAESKDHYRRLIQGKIQHFVLEKRYIRKNGDVKYCYIGVSPIRNGAGKTINTIGMITDITEQKQAEQQIKQRTEELSLINAMNTMINAGESIDQIFQYFSSSLLRLYACHITGFAMQMKDGLSLSFEHVSMPSKLLKTLENKVQKMVQKHVFVPPSDGLLMQCIHGKEPQLLRTKEEIRTIITEFATKKSTLKIIPDIVKLLNMNFVCNFPLRLGDDRLGMIITISRQDYDKQDVKRMKNLIEQMVSIIIRKRVEEERTKLSTVVEQMAETVVITDTEGNILYANPAFEKTSGYSREEAVNKNMNMLKSGKQRGDFYEKLWNTIERGKVWKGKMLNKRKNGTLYEERATISPITNEMGKIVNYVAVKQDITRESQLENQLIQSQKLETVGTLARGIAHDFNNILGTILGYNDMAMEEVASSEKIHRYLTHMRKASIRARDLVNQVLTFSQDFKPEPKSVKIQNLIRDSLTLFNPTASENINIETNIDQSLPSILADPSQIQQVLLNLLTNANQAMQDKGGNLIFSADTIQVGKTMADKIPDLTEGEYVRVSVADTGAGMDAETKSKIFEPFFSTKPVGIGTGLGLSVVHGIIKNHNGVITVESEKNRGTTFTIYLPV